MVYGIYITCIYIYKYIYGLYIYMNRKFRTGTLCMILNYWQSTSRYRASIGSYLLKIEKKSVIFSGSKQIPQRNTALSQGVMLGCFEFVLQDYIPQHVNTPHKKANF